MNSDSCAMKNVGSKAAVEAGAPGSFCIVEVDEHGAKFERLWVKFPHGEPGGFALEPAPAEIPGVWPWNGNEKKPTLKRRVKFTGRWCGQIKGGRLVSDPAPAQVPEQTPRPLPIPRLSPPPKPTRRR